MLNCVPLTKKNYQICKESKMRQEDTEVKDEIMLGREGVNSEYILSWLTALLGNLLADTCQESLHLDEQWEVRLGTELRIYGCFTNYLQI